VRGLTVERVWNVQMAKGNIVSVTNLDEIERARGRKSIYPGDGSTINMAQGGGSLELPTDSSADSDATAAATAAAAQVRVV
jgi:hypothetical protein